MGLFSALHRRTWKSAVVTEFHKLHGINLRAIGDQIGPGTLDDLLNVQYEFARNDPKLGAESVTRVLEQQNSADSLFPPSRRIDPDQGLDL